ncbi:hypothetical protein VNO78_13073 [Psophocarpus tetragonolobus]|uniref:Uncharacterized protein n=1 Tax=Psophocarpus tetragonolobus TaxID=3891 RepID=A0AAN9SRW3_PSOTE
MNNDDIAMNIEAFLNATEEHLTHECCIYKVPFELLKMNEDAYTPKVVSIGPFHHSADPCLLSMESHKQIYCKAFLRRNQTSLNAWIRYIRDKEYSIRGCYSHTLQCSSSKLVEIIVVDSGFIFELFLRYYSVYTSIVRQPWWSDNIRFDLLLLENQLPFDILVDLFNLSFNTGAVGGNNSIPSFIQLTFYYFSAHNASGLNFGDIINIRHFTDLIRVFYLQHFPQRRPRTSNELSLVMHCPTVTELSESGIRFKASKSPCLLNLEFSRGVLEIPVLVLGEANKVLFHNIVALERCHYPSEPYFTDYVTFMHFLVNTNKDVDELVRRRVLVNWVGDNVLNMFNSLGGNNIIVFNQHYFHLATDLNIFHDNPRNRFVANLRRWKGALSIGAIVLLILTVIQTVCSVMQVLPN